MEGASAMLGQLHRVIIVVGLVHMVWDLHVRFCRVATALFMASLLYDVSMQARFHVDMGVALWALCALLPDSVLLFPCKRPAAAPTPRGRVKRVSEPTIDPAEPAPTAHPSADSDIADPKGQAATSKLELLKKRAGYCGMCADVLRDCVGQCSRRTACKEHKDTRKLTQDEWTALEAQFWAEQTDPQAARVKRVEDAKARHAKDWKPPSAHGDASEDRTYRMEFGKHGGPKAKTIAEVMRVDPT